ncbi:putative NIT2-nitrilase [Violaceomyces palustris]|uniref:NIT2-nitrilase n=1 Tax=Violaceomyces palustris TaxID=1673888 RepID=A0ACD0P8P2_9BASI|nr:putative NIT2-nitrilase [Violaceomyces palustris]
MVLAAVAQFRSSSIITDNLTQACALIKKAATAGAKAIFLPEATDFIAPQASVAQLTRSRENQDFVNAIQQAAKQSSIFVSVGVHEPPGEHQDSRDSAQGDGRLKCYNTHLLIDDKGEVLDRYRKLHLFDVDIKGGMKILESDSTIKGSELVPPRASPIGKIGLLTCYDLRFPEPSLSLRRQGADILTYPSAFTVRTGAAHWEALLRARAIETQSYVLASAQVGQHEGTKRVSWGHAMIIDPWGSIVAQCSDIQPYRPTFCLAEIDLESLESVRKEMPLWDQRRTDIFPTL